MTRQPTPTNLLDDILTADEFSQENSTPAVVTAAGQITWFSTDTWRGAPAALIEKGHCSQERCECWTLAYNPDAADHHVRPDADKAPNLCIGCKSEARLRNRRTEMEHGDVAEHRKRLKAEDAEAERLLRAWLPPSAATPTCRRSTPHWCAAGWPTAIHSLRRIERGNGAANRAPWLVRHHQPGQQGRVSTVDAPPVLGSIAGALHRPQCPCFV